MSVPTSLKIPAGVNVVTLATSRGDFAAHESRPTGTTRGHILLIPGFTGSKEDFTPLLPLLAAAGWHATGYDQRGQFETVGTEDDDYSLAGLAADAVAVRETSGASRSHLLGHSFGGLVAQAALVADPAAWLSLILLDTGPAGFEGIDQVAPLQAAIAMVDEVGLDALHTAREASKQRQPPPDIAEFLRARFTSNAPASLKAIAGHLVSTADRIDEIAAIAIPKLVARGVNDDAWPHETQDDMAKRLGIEVVLIPDAAHSPALENTVATADVLIGFLF